MRYNINYFIEKFEKIKDEACTTETICSGGAGTPLKFDCLGHCRDDFGKFNLAEKYALLSLGNPVQAWDGKLDGFSQQTPRLRLLSYLRNLNRKQ
jgi:hypothetical protein